MEKANQKPVYDYWEFTRELKAQFNAVEALGRQFYSLEDLCEWSIKSDATCLNDEGERVCVVDDCLGRQQEEVYGKLQKAVKDLEAMLEAGRCCFTVRKG